jgi:GTP-binding protein
VLNKSDLAPASDLESRQERVVEALGWEGPVFTVSAATGAGTAALAQAIVRALEEMRLAVNETS